MAHHIHIDEADFCTRLYGKHWMETMAPIVKPYVSLRKTSSYSTTESLGIYGRVERKENLLAFYSKKSDSRFGIQCWSTPQGDTVDATMVLSLKSTEIKPYLEENPDALFVGFARHFLFIDRDKTTHPTETRGIKFPIEKGFDKITIEDLDYMLLCKYGNPEEQRSVK